MALDRNRIQGMGSSGEPLKCPEGHILQEWTARAGTCDGCRGRVYDGDSVLDCRRCNWYLCEACKATYKPPDTSIWGTLSSMVDVVAQDFSEMVNDVKALVGAADDEEEAPASGSVPAEDLMASPQVQEEAAEVLREFCIGGVNSGSEDMAAVLPSEQELDGLWGRCSILFGCVLQPGPIADALCSQLTSVGDDRPWQPILRALCALEHFHKKGTVGKEITGAVAARAEPLLRVLARGGTGAPPQCKDKAIVVCKALLGAEEPAASAAAGAGAAAGKENQPAATAAAKEPEDLLDLSS